MISRVLEWYRIVNAQPAPDTVNRRVAAATALVKSVVDADDWAYLAGMTAGVVAGFEIGHTAEAPHVALILSALRAEDATVPLDLAENALELRAIAAVALGELMVRNGDKPADAMAIMTAMLIQSGIGLRSRTGGKHLVRVLDDLESLAVQVLTRAQERRRRGSVVTSLTKVPTFAEAQADVAASVRALATAVRAALSELNKQASIDREELDILWWLYGASSATTGDAISELNPGKAAIVCGVDVANLCLLPPLVNADAFVREAMGKAKMTEANPSVEKLVGETDAVAWGLLRAEGDAQSLADDYPTLFPLSWAFARLTSSSGVAEWPAEFKVKTGIDATATVPPVDLALQAFRERIAQRQFASTD